MQEQSKAALIIGGAFLLGVGFWGGYFAADRASMPASVVQALGGEAPPEGVDFTPLWRAWQTIDERFVPTSVTPTDASSTSPVPLGTPEERRVYGMIQGLADSLGDPYTFYLPPVEQKQFEEDLSGNFEGVGMEIAVRDEVLTVVAPLKGTPAERAGLKPNDRVLKINDVETRGMDITTAVSRIRGPKGSEVNLLVVREGWEEPREIKVTRDVINIPILETETKDDVLDRKSVV